jgi:hypothetical protein
MRAFFNYSTGARALRMREMRENTKNVARDLVAEKHEVLSEGKEKRDVMSLIGRRLSCDQCQGGLLTSPLVKANISEQSESRLSEDEMLAKMQYVSLSLILEYLID